MNVYNREFLRDFRERLPQYEFFRRLPDGLAPLPPWPPFRNEIFAYQNLAAICQED